MHLYLLGSPLDRFLPISVLIVCIFMVLAFSVLHVPLAWGGILMAVLGFMLKNKNDAGEVGGEGERKPIKGNAGAIAAPVRGKFNLKGKASIFMICAGTVVAVVDIWRNGKPILPQAWAASADAVGYASPNTKKLMKGPENRELPTVMIPKGMSADLANLLLKRGSEDLEGVQSFLDETAPTTQTTQPTTGPATQHSSGNKRKWREQFREY
jgi:hypothetical protein